MGGIIWTETNALGTEVKKYLNGRKHGWIKGNICWTEENNTLDGREDR